MENIKNPARLQEDVLRSTIEQLLTLEFPAERTGFSTADIDLNFETESAKPAGVSDNMIAEPDRSAPAVSRIGDLWLPDKRRLICGNSQQEATYQALLDGKLAAMVFSDPPYYVPINGHVLGLGKTRHAKFPMASGEMSSPEFIKFLTTAFTLIAESLYYSWSKEFLEAGKKRLAGDTERQANSGEVKDLRREMRDMKELVAELTLENRLLKKSMIADGGDEA